MNSATFMGEEERNEIISEFGNELLFAIIGLETEPFGTKALFEVELRGHKRRVTVE